MTQRIFRYGLIVISLAIGVGGLANAEQILFTTDRDEVNRSSVVTNSSLALTSTGPRSSPFNPPNSNDSTFVTDAAPKLDTGCIFRSSGPIIYNIAVTRYQGTLNPDGTLKDAAALVAAGVVSSEATLVMPVYDVDSGAIMSPPYQPEIDRVLFNGKEIGFLSGVNNVWKLNSFQIPIGDVKFTDRAPLGSSPVGAFNEVKIEIDVGNAPIGQQLWCTAVDWGAESFDAMPPVILIHGNGSNGGFWDRRGFTQVLQANYIPYDNSINLNTNTVAVNGQTLRNEILNVAGSMGVQNIQIVAHSKGGLDTREFLASHYSDLEKNNQLKVHSLITLSTPHKGSVGADYIRAIELTRNLKLSNPNARTQLADWLANSFISTYTQNEFNANYNLTTQWTQGFNSRNRLPNNIQYYSVGADADVNNNGTLERIEYQTMLDEAGHPNLWDSIANPRMNTMYQALGNFSSATVRDTGTNSGWPFYTPIWEVVETPTSSFQENDMMVTVDSATYSFSFIGQYDKNHASVADGDVARGVIGHLKYVP